MKKYIINSLLLLLAPIFAACFSDKTTDPTLPISEITVSGIKEVYNIGKNDSLVIKPVISQSIQGKDITYLWEMNLENYSTDKNFEYLGKELGKYNCRFIAENEDGKTIVPFTLYVNSPYEEGITIISEDKNGRPMLSFMQVALEEGDKAEFIQGDCFAQNNPNEFFASYPTDIVQSGGRLVISCKGKDGGNDVPSIYYIDEKTMVVENIITAPEFPDFVPTILGILSETNRGSAYPILSENGKVYEYSPSEATIAEPRKLHSEYAQACIIDSGTYPNLIFWDNNIGNLAQIYNYNGPYYCGTKYHTTLEDCKNGLGFFNDCQFITMRSIHRAPDQYNTLQKFIIITQTDAVINSRIIAACFWDHNYDTGENYLVHNGDAKIVGAILSPINEKTPSVANGTYNSMLYADGNKVRRWYYMTDQHISEADVIAELGSKDAIITAFEISEDNTLTYVAYYEPAEEGLNGYMSIIDSDTGEVLDTYNNISYKAVKMIYKQR